MAQGYYTLEEAAKILNMPSDDLKQMARKGEIRAFQDRGTWRFRVQDIEELARRRGIGSEPDLVLGESLSPQPTDSPALRPPPKSHEEEVFDFSLATDDEDVGIGADLFNDVPADIGMTGPKSGPKSGGPKSGDPKSGGSKNPSKIAGTKNPSKIAGTKNPSKIAGTKSPSKIAGTKSPSKIAGTKSPSKIAGPKSPVSKGPSTPQPGSDSDVRLVSDGSDIDFELPIDSDVGMASSKSPKSPKSGAGGPRSSKLAGPASPRPASPRPSKIDPTKKSSRVDLARKSGLAPSEPADSGVRLVPMDSDSDVKIVGAPDESDAVALGKQPPMSSTDSDIRLERDQTPSAPHSDEGQLTEEINLDEELRKAESQPPSKALPDAKINFPTHSPFELSEPDIDLPEVEDSSVGGAAKYKSSEDSSSDFDLTPAGESSSPIDPGSDDFSLEVPDDGAVDLGEAPAADDLKGPTTGISLDNPADSGISLEQGGDGSDEIEFELSLDGDSTPKPGTGPGSSSEFELTVDEAPAAAGEEEPSSSEFELTLEENADDSDSTSSEFELTLDEGEPVGSISDSDSEFELTLDDSGSLSPLAEESESAEGAEGDIFETDMDVPALEEESGSEAVALEDEETSDFDLALTDDDVSADEESGSEAIALDEDSDVDEEDDDRPRKKAKAKPKTKSKPKTKAKAKVRQTVPADDDEGVGSSLEDLDLDGDITVDDEEDTDAPVREVVRERIIMPAPWGLVPVIFMVPCVAVMFMVGIMGFELIQSMSGHKPPGLFTRTVADMILPANQKLKS